MLDKNISSKTVFVQSIIDNNGLYVIVPVLTQCETNQYIVTVVLITSSKMKLIISLKISIIKITI